MYKCGLCGKEYRTIEERARCELRCFASMQENDKLNKQKRLQIEEAADIKEIQDMYDAFIEKFTQKIEAFKTKYHKTIRLQNHSYDVLPSLLSMFDLMRF